MNRRPVLVIAGVSAVILVAVGAAFFQPWRLFTTTVVDEALPPLSSASPSESVVPRPIGSASPSPTASEQAATTEPTYTDLAAGTFITHEHDTTGAVRVVAQPDGTRVLAITGLRTSDGPDLRVWLTDQPVIEGTAGWGVFDDGTWVELGPLKGNVGDQVYAIPGDVDLTSIQSVSIWCARFAVSFGAATLTPI
ncbi:DM13 domain-containing protein [Microbacterium sp. P01]|uniref:DM13 domain-containing protein n=1 Tax=Microbacterium sp. P01 TaxID=3366261 RepID=UPI0036710CC0